MFGIWDRCFIVNLKVLLTDSIISLIWCQQKGVGQHIMSMLSCFRNFFVSPYQLSALSSHFFFFWTACYFPHMHFAEISLVSVPLPGDAHVQPRIIPFESILKPPVPFSTQRENCWVPGAPVTVTVTGFERQLALKMLNPNLWVDIEWVDVMSKKSPSLKL